MTFSLFCRLMLLAADSHLVVVVLSKESKNVQKTLERITGRMGKAQAFEKLTVVQDGLSLIMQAIKRGSVPIVEAVFTAMMSVLDDDQVSYVGGQGVISNIHNVLDMICPFGYPPCHKWYRLPFVYIADE